MMTAKNKPENANPLLAFIEQNAIEPALGLLATAKWPKKTLDKVFGEFAWRATSRRVQWTAAHLQLATALLDAGANVNAPFGYKTALHYAAEAYNLAFVTLLLERGAQVNATTDTKETPLSLALGSQYDEAAHLPVIRALLEAGADPRIVAIEDTRSSSLRDTPLVKAIQRRALETAQLLVAHGADVTQAGYGNRRPIHAATYIAARDGDRRFLEWLLAVGVDLNVVCFEGPPLAIGTAFDNPALIDWLVDAGADVRDAQALVSAVKAKRLKTARRLLERGADPNKTYQMGTLDYVPLIEAISHAQPDMVALLLEYGARLDRRYATYHGALTPLEFAGAVSFPQPEIMALLLQAQVAQNATLAQKQLGRYLVEAAYRPQVSQFPPLAHWLEQGADPNATNEYGRTALHYVVEHAQSIDHARLLLEAGASVNVRDTFGYTPLHQAARQDNPAMVSALLEAGADPAARLTQGRLAGWTPLHFALSYEHTAIVALLRPLSPPIGAVAPGSHGLRGVFSINPNTSRPAEKTTPIYLHKYDRCVKCHERALYIIGSIADGTGLDAESTRYYTCANCGAHQIRVWSGPLELYTGHLPWHVLE